MSDSSPSRLWLRWLLIGVAVFLLAGASVGYYLYDRILGTNLLLDDPVVVDVPRSVQTPTEMGWLLAKRGIILDYSGFVLTANLMKFRPKPGRFEIPASVANNRQLIRILRGSPMIVTVTFHNFRKKEQLAGHIGRQLELDSTDLIQLLNDKEFLEEQGFTPENVLSAFIPNTYELYWNTSADAFWERMIKEHQKFWSAERLQKAKDLSLSTQEVYTLASIVESESQYRPERPRIAGVYLNRLQTNGWTLDADPTVVYAVGDFTLKRLLTKHTQIDSPYNTYKYPGLPPGPIYMASINSIDAVLNAEKHDYWFFCAKPPSGDGAPKQHAFARTSKAHINNAKKYWRWLNAQR